MAHGQPIILPEGVGAGTPFSIGKYALITGVTPPTIANGRLGQLADAAQSIVAPDVSGALRTFVMGDGSRGGASIKTTLIGEGIKTNFLAGSDRNIGIGGQIDFSAAAGGVANNIWIGWDFIIGTPTNTSNNVLIGHSITTTIASAGVVGIGNDCSVRGGDSVTIGDLALGGAEANVIGKQAQGNTQSQAFGKLAFATGLKAIAIGDRAKATQDNEIAIGPDLVATAFTNAVRIGRSSEVFENNAWGLGGDQANGTEMRVLRLGPNTLAGYAGLSVFLPSADAANNQPGPPTTIRGGISTGNAAAGGKLTLQSSLIGAGGGAYQAVIDVLRVQSGGTVGNPTIAFLNQISTPGAAAGTLLNAPVAGNPAIWAEVLYNGVLHYIPMW